MNLHVRAANLGDAEAIDSLLSQCASAYLGRSRGSGEAAERLRRPGTDAALVLDLGTGDLLGFGHSWPSADETKCFARVRPDATGRGVGTVLLTYLETRATTGTISVTQWATDIAGPALLRARGYTETLHQLQMWTPLPAHKQDTPVPAEVREFDPDRDSQGVFAAWCDAFGQQADEHDWWRERRDDPTVHFDPSLWLVSEDGEDITGFCLGRHRDDKVHGTVGYVGDVGVRPQWRGRGLGFALLTRMLERFTSSGLPAAGLDVDAANLTGALRLYAKAGMQPRPNFTVWSKQLAA